MGAPEPQAGTGPAIPSASSVATAALNLLVSPLYFFGWY